MSSRWTWRLLALPGVAWLSIFFLVAFYAVDGRRVREPELVLAPVPFWNPLDWNVGYVLEVLRDIWHGGQYLTVFLRTFAFVAIAIGLFARDRLPGRVLRRPARGRWRGLVLLLLVSCRSGSTT